MTNEDLKAWRQKHGLTQPELAALLDVSLDSVRSWEQGRRPLPSLLAPALKEYERQLKRRQVRR